MIYIYRTLCFLIGIVVYFITCVAFGISFITYPFVSGVYYIIHGSTDGMKFDIDTIPEYIVKQYKKLRDYIEKQNKH